MFFPELHNEFLKEPEEYQNFIGRLYHQDYPGLDHLVFDLTFQVCDDCCLNCSYCYQGFKGHHKMSFETAKKAIDQLLRADDDIKGYINSWEIPAVVINFIGGEPFLEIDLIDQITDYFVSKMIEMHHPWATKYRISISTNGILYFDPRVQEYIKKNQNVLGLSISIDGDKELHDSCRVFPDGSGSYEKAMEAVRHYMTHYNNEIGSKMTIAPGNVEYVYRAVVSMIKNGYKTINLNCVYEKGWELHHATTLYWQLKKLADYLLENDLWQEIYLSIFYLHPGTKSESNENWCGGNGEMLALNWRGRYYPCLRYMEDSVGPNKEYYIGDIEKGIGQDELTALRVKELRSITYQSQSPQECIDCGISTGCGWCTAYNYQEMGSVNKRATFICDMHYATVLASLYYFNSIYEKLGETYRLSFNGIEDKALAIIPKEEFEIIKEMTEDGNRNDNNP